MKRTERQTHTCEYCGKQFKARKGAKYCSNSCRVLANKVRHEELHIPTFKINKPVEPKNKPVDNISQPIGTIPQQRVLTKEEARQEILTIAATMGIVWVLNTIDKALNSRRRK